MRHGSQVAKPKGMSEDKPVRIVRQYDRPDFQARRARPAVAESGEVEYLKDQLLRQKDQIRRLKYEIEDEIKMLIAALEEDKQESIGQVRRRISRLRGSLEYKGVR